MLAIVDRTAEGCLALLEQLRIETTCDRRRLQADHGPQRQLPRANLALGHRHEPIGAKNFVCASRTALLCGIEESLSVKHEHPVALHDHEHGDLHGIGLGRRA